MNARVAADLFAVVSNRAPAGFGAEQPLQETSIVPFTVSVHHAASRTYGVTVGVSKP